MPLALALDDDDNPVVRDLVKMPHLLITGGRNQAVNDTMHAIIASVLLSATPDENCLLLVDPNGTEFGIYTDVPHLLSPVTHDAARGMELLSWLVHEMESRYTHLARAKVISIGDYERRRRDNNNALVPMPRIIVAVTQFEVLRALSSAKFDQCLVRLAQDSRAVGIHLLFGMGGDTSAIPAIVRANIPLTLLLDTSSRFIAHQLVRYPRDTALPRDGELVFFDGRSATPPRRQIVYPLADLRRLADHWRAQRRPGYLPESAFDVPSDDEPSLPDDDELYMQAVALVTARRKVSTTWLQRELRIGYNGARRLIERMEKFGIVSSPETQGRRRVLITPDGRELPIEDVPSDFNLTPAAAEIYSKERNLWQSPSGRRTIDRQYTVEELLALIEASSPEGDEAKATFLSKLQRGLVERFPETNQLTDQTRPLPSKTPEGYQGLRGPETPPEFVKRVYGPWLGKGLDRAHIKQLDPKLYTAIDNWTRKPGNEWPADVDLPTRAAHNRRLLSAGPEAVREHLGKFTGEEALREAARLQAVAHRQK